MASASGVGAWRRGWIFGAGLLAALAGVASAAPTALLTILEGEAVLHVGARSIAAAEGLRVADATIIETSATTNLLRLELADGSLLDLGPATQVMLQPGQLLRPGGVAPAYYLLRGWTKQRSAAGTTHRGHVSPLLDVLPAQGTQVSLVSDEGSWVFAESAAAALLERGGGARVDLPAGAGYLRPGSARGEVQARPDPELLKRVPRGFRDTIGPRAARFAGKDVAERALPPPDYAALRPWLAAEPAVRREFPRRFAPLMRDRAFRAALIKHLPAHPEWERRLFPERFVKPAQSPTGGAR